MNIYTKDEYQYNNLSNIHKDKHYGVQRVFFMKDNNNTKI